MPDVTSNIYIDFDAGDPSGGSEVVNSELTVASIDNIGAMNIPSVVFIGDIAASFKDINTNYIYSPNISGSEDVSFGYFHICTTISGIDPTSSGVYYITTCATTIGFVDKPVSYSSNEYLMDTFTDLVSWYFNPDILGSGYSDVKTDAIIGEKYNSSENVLHQFWGPEVFDGSLNYDTEYISGFLFPYSLNFSSSFIKSTVNSGFSDSIIDSTFAGYVLNNMYSNIFSSFQTTSNFITETSILDGGGLVDISSDIFNSILDNKSFITDNSCNIESNYFFISNICSISGGLDFINQDVYSSISEYVNFKCDINLFPLKIENFSLSVDDWEFASEFIYVDIVDDINSLNISECYFKINNDRVAVTTSVIPNGIRIFYNISNSLKDIQGPATITAHGENNIGDALEEDFILVFGYRVDYENYERIGYNFGLGQKIAVRISAENLASCPSFYADSFWFETKEGARNELTANITGIYTYDSSSVLNASIYPKSTAFFYGKVFHAILTAKDFSGNEMEPLEFEFKIEDAPN